MIAESSIGVQTPGSTGLAAAGGVTGNSQAASNSGSSAGGFLAFLQESFDATAVPPDAPSLGAVRVTPSSSGLKKEMKDQKAADTPDTIAIALATPPLASAVNAPLFFPTLRDIGANLLPPPTAKSDSAQPETGVESGGQTSVGSGWQPAGRGDAADQPVALSAGGTASAGFNPAVLPETGTQNGALAGNRAGTLPQNQPMPATDLTPSSAGSAPPPETVAVVPDAHSGARIDSDTSASTSAESKPGTVRKEKPSAASSSPTGETWAYPGFTNAGNFVAPEKPAVAANPAPPTASALPSSQKAVPNAQVPAQDVSAQSVEDAPTQLAAAQSATIQQLLGDSTLRIQSKPRTESAGPSPELAFALRMRPEPSPAPAAPAPAASPASAEPARPPAPPSWMAAVSPLNSAKKPLDPLHSAQGEHPAGDAAFAQRESNPVPRSTTDHGRGEQSSANGHPAQKEITSSAATSPRSGKPDEPESPDAPPSGHLTAAEPLSLAVGHEAAPTVPRETSRPPQTDASPAPALSPAASKQELPARPAQELSLSVSSDNNQKVELRLVDRAGEVHVSVRTPDEALARSMREDLGNLTAKLGQSGFSSEAYMPASGSSSEMSGQRGSSENRDGSAGSQQGSRQSNSDPQQQSSQDGRGKRPSWVEEMETSLAQGQPNRRN